MVEIWNMRSSKPLAWAAMYAALKTKPALIFGAEKNIQNHWTQNNSNFQAPRKNIQHYNVLHKRNIYNGLKDFV